MSKYEKSYVKVIIDSGGHAEFSNWSIYKEGNFYYTDCFCCPRTQYKNFDLLWDDLLCDIDTLVSNNGHNIL